MAIGIGSRGATVTGSGIGWGHGDWDQSLAGGATVTGSGSGWGRGDWDQGPGGGHGDWDQGSGGAPGRVRVRAELRRPISGAGGAQDQGPEALRVHFEGSRTASLEDAAVEGAPPGGVSGGGGRWLGR
jgi:hypothetical protein